MGRQLVLLRVPKMAHTSPVSLARHLALDNLSPMMLPPQKVNLQEAPLGIKYVLPQLWAVERLGIGSVREVETRDSHECVVAAQELVPAVETVEHREVKTEQQ